MRITEPTKLSETVIDGEIVAKLYIAPYHFDSELSLSEEQSLLTDSYEIVVHSSTDTFRTNLRHNIKTVDDVAFKLPRELEVGYASRLTDWELDEDGEVESINVPDEPYDEGSIVLPPGVYRVWEEDA